MGEAFAAVIATAFVGMIFLLIGNDLFNGLPEMGPIAAIATASGLIVFFNK
ncbi:MAG: hypothetical protein GX219_01050, partial [Tissierellia bacterium]|nr:hypothetical protein [Tissierellia bacterium]